MLLERDPASTWKSIAKCFGDLFGLSGRSAMLLAADQTVLGATLAARQLFDLASEGTIPVPQFPRELEQAIEQASQGKVVRAEMVRPAIGDTGGTFELTVQPLAVDGTVVAFLVHAYDVTALRRAERVRDLLSQMAAEVNQTEDVSQVITAALQNICEMTEGRLAGTIAAERIRAEEELRILAERMREAVVSRDNILALVSHDLRNPLHAIALCLSGLRENPPPTAVMAAELVMLAQESVAVMSRIIQDLLDVASIDAGRLSLERAPQPLGPIVRHAVELHRILAAEGQLTLLVDDAPGMDQIVVNVDGERILQVLSNLIGNACKFTDPGGQATIAALSRTDDVLVTVRDTGCGIPPEAIPHIFDRFWHAQRRGTTHRSTGLGLTIARGIVEAHGGRLWVESTVGEGSTFFLTVPSGDVGQAPTP